MVVAAALMLHSQLGLACMVLLGLIAALTLVLNPREPLGRMFAAVLALTAIGVTSVFFAPEQRDLGWVLRTAAFGLSPAAFLAFCIESARRHTDQRVPHLARWLRLRSLLMLIGPALALVAIGYYLLGDPVPSVIRTPLSGMLVVAFLAGLVVQGISLRHATNRDAAYALATMCAGGAVGAGPAMLGIVLPALFGMRPPLSLSVAAVSYVAFPVAVGFATIRWRSTVILALVDRVSVYILLGAALALPYAGIVLLAERITPFRLPTFAEVILLTFAAVTALTFVPLQRWVQRVVDRLVYRDYYEVGPTVERFSREMAHLRDQEGTIRLLLDGIATTLNLAGAAYVALPEGLSPSVLGLLEPDDVRGLRDLANIPGRQAVLAGLRTLDERTLAAVARLPVRDPWPGCALLVFVGTAVDSPVAGLLVVGPKRAGSALRREDVTLLATLAHHAATALDNAQLVDGLRISLLQVETATAQLTAARAEQQLLLSQLVSADERQRLALARDLHDDALQDVLYLIRHAQLCQRLADAAAPARMLAALASPSDSTPSADRLRDELGQLAGRATSVQDKLRALCLGLYPELLHSFGLAVAIEDLADRLRATTGARVTAETDDVAAAAAAGLAPEVALHLYRIVQESANNAAKHAAASAVSMRMHVRGRRDDGTYPMAFTPGLVLALDVTDDGTGIPLPIDYAALLKDGHMGIAGMRQRADQIGAHLLFSRSAAGGTHVHVEVPLSGATGVPDTDITAPVTLLEVAYARD